MYGGNRMEENKKNTMGEFTVEKKKMENAETLKK
ncbi:MAG: hypothetical protein ACJAUP_001295 [Cellvibrionaceae bacterium]